MNGNLNLCEILKDCPKGTILYSTVYGYVEFVYIQNNSKYPIVIKIPEYNSYKTFTFDGRVLGDYDEECVLFPSKEQRDWSKFKVKKLKFDPMTFNPFDKVLRRCKNIDIVWSCDSFSHLKDRIYVCSGCMADYVIPYNEDTKHLRGTTEEAPEFYRYWEE